MRTFVCVLSLAVAGSACGQASKPFRLPSVDLKQRIIWGSEASGGGFTLAFGGQDQQGEEGAAPTRLKVGDGEWQDLRAELRKANPDQKVADALAQVETELSQVRQRIATDRFRGREPSKADLDQATEFTRVLQLGGPWELFATEPRGRALCGLVYEPKSGLFVMFGGDRGDYLVNDVWTFDPKARKWEPRSPKTAPPPRANHKLTANGDGTVTLTGGYTYTSNTDYMGGQYCNINDGEWVYDVKANTWKGEKPGVAPWTRTYRTGPFDPAFYLEGPPPDPKAFGKVLAELPANTWVKTNPPRLPQMNRDWGTAILDPDGDRILRYSGGHCAHCGTDVLHFHLSTNRWELTRPVEFPLGQTYTNTEYPDGWNFNRRPWITGHTYQNYGYDPVSHQMLFLGRDKHFYTYHPDRGDWGSERFAKPKGMDYGDCFYTLTTTPTPQGLVCWTNAGRLFRFEADKWVEMPLTGDKLPGAVVDNSTLTYDSKRDRLLFFVKKYDDKPTYNGQIFAVDCKTREVKALSPDGMAEAKVVPYLCQIRYAPELDLCFVGGRMSDGRTPAFDCAANRWVSLKLAGDDPNGPKGRNVSLGLVHDPKRKLFWAVDTKSHVYVLKLDRESADIRPLKE